MKRAIGIGLVGAIFVLLIVVFFQGIGRTDPEDQYGAILGSDFHASASPFREFARADSASAIAKRGSATAVAVFEGPGLHESLSFTVYETEAPARAALRAVRDAYARKDTFQDINASPREFCARLPQHHLDCFVAVDNLFLHSSVVPLPSEWKSQSFKTEFEPLYLLRTGYKGWSAYFSSGSSGRR